jgi:putative ABC transport system substrate-binding protein
MAGVVRHRRVMNMVYAGCRRLWVAAIIILLVSIGLDAKKGGAAERPRPVRIGALTISWGPTPMIAGLRDGLVALGYRDEQDFFLGVRFTQGDASLLPTAARDLVHQGVDLIIVDDDEALAAARQASSRIPIVFAALSNPLGFGFIESFARPGGNVTGVTDLALKLGAKRLQVFQEMLPHVRRIMFPYNPAVAQSVEQVGSYQDAARQLGIDLLARPVRTEAEARALLGQIQRGDVDGLLAPHSIALNIPGVVLEAGTQQGIPTLFDSMFFVDHGGLASYGPAPYETGRQAARLVDKILNGANPAEIPIEVNPKIEFAINLKTAAKLGLAIPPEVLYQADRLIQ